VTGYPLLGNFPAVGFLKALQSSPLASSSRTRGLVHVSMFLD